MATSYVDAGQAIDNSSLSRIVGSAPPEARLDRPPQPRP